MTNQDWPIGVRFVDLAAGLEAITGIERYPRSAFSRATAGGCSAPLTSGPTARRPSRSSACGTSSPSDSPCRCSNRAFEPAGGRNEQARCLRRASPSRFRAAIAGMISGAAWCRSWRRRRGTGSRSSSWTIARPRERHAGSRRSSPGSSWSTNAGPVAQHAMPGSCVRAARSSLRPTMTSSRQRTGSRRCSEPFAESRVSAVTGNVLPLELETQAQCRFESYGGLGKGFDRMEFDSGVVPQPALGGSYLAHWRDRERGVSALLSSEHRRSV